MVITPDFDPKKTSGDPGSNPGTTFHFSFLFLFLLLDDIYMAPHSLFSPILPHTSFINPSNRILLSFSPGGNIELP